MLLRPEVVGTVLVVLAAAAVPSVVPLTGVVGEARDGVIGALGLHVFTTIGLLAALGAVLALRRADLLLNHARHLVGGAVLLLFIAGLLARWHPETSVGGVDLREVSAGGSLGRLFTGGSWQTLGWLVLAPLGYALLWPRTAWSIARATPPATWETLKWLWALGLHRRAASGLGALLFRHRSTAPVEADAAEGGAPPPRSPRRPRAI